MKKHPGWCPAWCVGRIVNRRETDQYDVFIGHGSKWGNPFNIEDFGRLRAIRIYETHIRRRPDLIAALPELAGKILGCYCHPLPCHGEVLLKLLWEYHRLR
jgi:hypothetical protein